jgi:probable F420-dependent oxidoreductase
MRLRVGVQLQPQRAEFAAIRDASRALDEMGLDTLFTSDHFVSVPGDRDGLIFECWTTLAALAEVTERIWLGPLVSCTSYRNANLLADTARTVDHISDGRLILGLGAGWFEPDYLEYGYEFGNIGHRLTSFERALSVIDDRFPRLNPPPLRGTVPILIGGGGERRMLRLVARHADIWNLIADPEAFRRKNVLLDAWCEKVGRDPAELERSVLMVSEEQLERADDYVQAGATHLIFDLGPPPWPLGLAARLVEWRERRQPLAGAEQEQPLSLGTVVDAASTIRNVEVGDTEMALHFDP